MQIVYLIFAWITGSLVASFLFWPPVIILVFGIPFSIELKRLGVLTSTKPAWRYAISFVLLMSLFALASWAMWTYVPKYIWGYIIGIVITLPYGFKNCGRTPANLRDYFESNKDCIDRAALEAFDTHVPD